MASLRVEFLLKTESGYLRDLILCRKRKMAGNPYRVLLSIHRRHRRPCRPPPHPHRRPRQSQPPGHPSSRAAVVKGQMLYSFAHIYTSHLHTYRALLHADKTLSINPNLRIKHPM